MQTLTIDPPVPFLVPPDAPIQIILVGAGGTGSHILQSLARLAAHVGAAGGPGLEIVVLDGDAVEAKNVGRQLFSRADVGLNKAQALATRFSAVFGLAMLAVPAMATPAILADLARRRPRAVYPILVGAVDTAAARRVLHDALVAGQARLWLDCGNEADSGQVCVGSATTPAQLAGCLALAGVCAALPAPSLLYPNLITPPKQPKRGDCAAAVAANVQDLMTNQAVAAVAAQYLYTIVVRRRLTTFDTCIALSGLAMRSQPITAARIAEATGLDAATLTTAPMPKQKGRAA
jgi:PRTRC genetic system ThiF family protein